MGPYFLKSRLQLERLFILTAVLLLLFSLQNCKENPTSAEIIENEQINTEYIPTKQGPEKKVILFYGNSLTAGLGLEENETFPSLIQKRIDSLGWDFEVINGGLSGETTSNGLERLDWVLRQKIDMFVLELGANDMLRGLDIEATEKNLQAMLDKVKEKYPEAKLVVAGMQSPPNMGPDYAEKFNGLFAELAEKNNATLIPFILEGVAGIETLNLEDRKHPNAKGQQIVMENVWKAISPVLKTMMTEPSVK